MNGCILNVSYPFAVVADSTAGGAEQILLSLDAAIERAGYQSLVLAPPGSNVKGILIESELADAPYNEINRARIYGVLKEKISNIIEDYHVDLVHYHGLDFNEYLPNQDIPVLVTLHLPVHWYKEEAFIEGRKRNVVFNCVSYSQYVNCEKFSDPFVYIENGVSLPPYLPCKLKGKYTVSMGRICPEKGFHLSIDASKKAGFAHLIYGKVYPYPQHIGYFHSQIAPRLGKRIKFGGQIGLVKRNKILSSAHCLLVPSLVEETSSLVAMEALSCGTPVIAFKTGALVDIIQNGVNGFLVNDEFEMAEAILQVNSIDPLVCYNIARKKYTKDRMASQYIDLYERILHKDSADISCI